ncbi:DUF4843 domain-containing protein [Chitinophaga sp.]|mgnify:CR=1 FL=1|uniref:DUF4843 domain-containing protein n=1 Tax=Chitinophaga sp. TaxID=1869181 RepID=UPI00262588A8|nr:DUF4843 domain-containing protein [uncultured Chitinophaga sp.]
MKKILSILTGALLLGSCQKSEVPFYDGPSSVYFDVYREVNPGTEYLADTSIVSFGFAPKLNDSTITLRIRTQGDTTNAPRRIDFRVVDTAANAARAEQYQLPASVEIPAGKNFALLNVIVRKTPDMQEKNFTLTLELMPNDKFQTPVKDAYVSARGRNVNIKSHVLVLNDIISRPRYWMDPLFGPFSRKKLLLICEVLDLPVGLFDTQVSYGNMRFYGRFVRNYLEAEAKAGRTVLEEDGSEMKMGDGL